MTRSINRRDIASLMIASFATLLMSLTTPSPGLQQAGESVEQAPADTALAELVDVDWAEREGAWWLDEDAVDAELSFAPEHKRLVWRVSGHEGGVVLDAKTGEALAFEYE